MQLTFDNTMKINEKEFLKDLERLKRAQKASQLLDEFIQKLEVELKC